MANETITSEEVELLAQETELLAKKEQGENLESEEEETLGKINSLKEELKERFREKEIPQKTKEEILSLQAQKEHFRNKYEKEKTDRESLLKELEIAKKKAPLGDKTEWQEKVDFLLVHKDISKEEFEIISALAKGKGSSLEDVMSSKDTQEYIEFQREKVAKTNAIPTSSGATIGSFKIKTQEEIANMTPEQHKAYTDEFNKRKRKEMGV